MAKFSRENDDEPYRPHRSGGSAGNIVRLAVGGAVLVVVGVCAAGALFLFTARSEVREAQMMRAEAEALRDEARAAEVMTRNDAAAGKAVKSVANGSPGTRHTVRPLWLGGRLSWPTT
jgi:hypothetical protein